MEKGERYRDTTTGAVFEEMVHVKQDGVNVSKGEMYNYLKEKGINWKDILSKRLLPDEAYWDNSNKILYIYEKKHQHTSGSADEKLQTGEYKVRRYKELFKSLGIKECYFTYICNDWFKRDEYKDTFRDIKENQPHVNYIIVDPQQEELFWDNQKKSLRVSAS